MTKKFLISLITLICMMSMVISIHAEEKLELDKTGSITLIMKCDGVELDGGSVSFYLIGLVEEDAGKLVYKPIEELEKELGPLDRIDDSGLANKAAELAEEKMLQKNASVVKNGKAVFNDVPVGLYVVVQKEAEATKGYCPINPFVISMPQLVEGSCVYEIVAEPKVSVNTPEESLTPEESSVPEESSMPEESSVPEKPEKPEESSRTNEDLENSEELDEPTLPQTGQLQWPIPVLVVLGLVFFGLGWFLKYGKKNGDEK